LRWLTHQVMILGKPVASYDSFLLGDGGLFHWLQLPLSSVRSVTCTQLHPQSVVWHCETLFGSRKLLENPQQPWLTIISPQSILALWLAIYIVCGFLNGSPARAVLN
jgi:hypothetical protein